MFNQDVIHILNKEELKQPSRSLDRRQKLEHIVRQHAGYQDMAKRSLRTPWMELTDTERREFFGLFIQYSATCLPVGLMIMPKNKRFTSLNN